MPENNSGNNNNFDKRVKTRLICLLFLFVTILIVVLIVYINFNDKKNLAIAQTKTENFEKNDDIRNLDIEIFGLGYLNESRSYPFVAKLSNDKMLVWGGYKYIYEHKSSNGSGGGGPKHIIKLKTAEIYNLKTQKSKTISSVLHDECLGIYSLENGKILLLSKNNDCQFFDPQKEKFEKAFPGIKILPDLDLKEELIFIKKNPNEILITTSYFKKLIKLNVYTGKHELLFDNENHQYLAAIPMDNDNILCFGKLDKEIYKCLSEDWNNKTSSCKNCGTVGNDISIFNVNDLKQRKIGSLSNNDLYLKFIKISDNKFLLYTNNSYDKNYIKKIVEINNKGIEENNYNILIYYDMDRFCEPIKLSEQYIFFAPNKIFNIQNALMYEIPKENNQNKEQYRQIGLAGFMSPYAKGVILLNSNEIVLVGGNNDYLSDSNNSIAVLKFYNN